MASIRFDCPFTGDSFKGGLLERLRSTGASDNISIHCNRPVADGEDDCTIEDLIGTDELCVATSNRGFGAAYVVGLELPQSDCRFWPTHYSLRHGWNGAVCLLRRWVLEGANVRDAPCYNPGGGDNAGLFDGWAWTVLSKHHDDASLASGFAVQTWELELPPGGQQPYTHFRLRMTGPSSDFSHEICTSGFEVFGSSAPQWWSVESHSSMPSGLRAAARVVMQAGTRVRRDQTATSSLALAPTEIWLGILGFLRCTDYFPRPTGVR